MTSSIISFNRPLVLSTFSPARRKLVADIGLVYRATSADIDETPLKGEHIKDYVRRLAEAKAIATGHESDDEVIIAVDTSIGLDNEIIGKATDEPHCRDILNKLSGRTHDVVSAIAVRDIKNNKITIEETITAVTFAKLSQQTVDWYVSTGEWQGKAGAYAIQGKGSALVTDVRGCYTNVIGISIPTLLHILGNIK